MRATASASPLGTSPSRKARCPVGQHNSTCRTRLSGGHCLAETSTMWADPSARTWVSRPSPLMSRPPIRAGGSRTVAGRPRPPQAGGDHGGALAAPRAPSMCDPLAGHRCRGPPATHPRELDLALDRPPGHCGLHDPGADLLTERRSRGLTGQAPQQREDEHVEGHEGTHRIARQRHDRATTDVAGPCGIPGRMATLTKSTVPAASRTSLTTSWLPSTPHRW